jgi:hypothetical protein
MAKKPIRYMSWDGLLNQGVSDTEMRDDQLTYCKNCWVDKIGKLEKVPGYTQEGDQVVDTKSVNLLHHYYRPSTKVHYLVAGSDTGSNYGLKYRTTGNFSTVNVGSTYNSKAGAQPCMVNYLDKVFIVGYKNSDKSFLTNATLDGTTFSAADSDITDMPQGKYIIRYRDLLYVLHAKTGGVVYPSRAYFSDEPTAETIGWTGIATRFVTFGYDDGDEITGGIEAFDRLIAFKHRSMWSYDESQVKKLYNIGCDSHRSIVEDANGIIYWYNKKGFWRSGGGAPELISERAKEFTAAMDQANPENVVGAIYDENEYRAFMGDITLGEDIYNNAWFCWNIDREQAYIRCTYDEVKSVCLFEESDTGKVRTYFGDDDGYVLKFAHKVDKVYADNGNDIDSFFVTKALDHGFPEDRKDTNEMTTFTKNFAGMNFQVEHDNSGVFSENRKQIQKEIDTNNLSGTANRFRYRFAEKGRGKSWEFEGFVIKTELDED